MYILEVEPLDLGPDVRAIGLELAEAERVREVGRLGRRRAEMIAHNHKVDDSKRVEKAEIARWFAIWLETPDTFFDWLELRKKSPEFQQKFAGSDTAAAG